MWILPFLLLAWTCVALNFADWADLPDSYGDENPINLLERSGSKGLLEFDPISNQIGQSELQYYSFNVNASSGLGDNYELLIFLTGNICLEPSDRAASANQSLTVYYSFNGLMFLNFEIGQMVQFSDGYFQALADVPILSTNTVLYIAVRGPESTNTTALWSYEIGVSQNDLVFQWDNKPFATVVDTDYRSALVVTGNLTSSSDDSSNWNASLSTYQLYVYSYENKNYLLNLQSSWCAVRNGPALLSTSSYTSSYTTRGGGLHQQFYVEGLNASTKYVAYLLSDFSGSSFGGVVYSQFEFETLAEDACTLLYDLDFCNEVAYSVPALSLLEYDTTDSLKTLYDDYAKKLYSNFSKALQQVPCNTTAEAIYLPIRTCDDCALLYKNWLCSVTIPRCSTRNITGYLYRDVNESRSDFVNEIVVPEQAYFEVLPCVNVCHAIVRDCPALFSFACPKTNATISKSYYWDTGAEYALCNFVGTQAVEESGARRMAAVLWAMLITFVSIMAFLI